MNDIAKILNMSVGKIYKYFKIYGIESRNQMSNKAKKQISQSSIGKQCFKGHKHSNNAKEKNKGKSFNKRNRT